MPFRKNLGFNEGASGCERATTVRRHVCEYSVGRRDDPVTMVLALDHAYGRSHAADGDAHGMQEIETATPGPEGRRRMRLVAEGGFEPPTKGL